MVTLNITAFAPGCGAVVSRPGSNEPVDIGDSILSIISGTDLITTQIIVVDGGLLA